jgi:hypothetical protein
MPAFCLAGMCVFALLLVRVGVGFTASPVCMVDVPRLGAGTGHLTSASELSFILVKEDFVSAWCADFPLSSKTWVVSIFSVIDSGRYVHEGDMKQILVTAAV